MTERDALWQTPMTVDDALFQMETMIRRYQELYPCAAPDEAVLWLAPWLHARLGAPAAMLGMVIVPWARVRTMVIMPRALRGA